jgi:quercetin dioxygenase-like cupin family protein
MKLFRFDAAVSRPIEAFGSQALSQLWLARLEPGPAIRVSVMHLGPGGSVGYHQAGPPQLFAVVQGAGWVTGEGEAETRERVPIVAGQAAFWEAGEWHESGSEAGMMVIVVEAESLTPERWLTLLS